MNAGTQVSPASWVVEQPFAPLTAAPWANGLGATTELVGYERSRTIRSGLAAPEWRLSIAELREPAAFSPLPGVHRNFMPVGGDVVLEVNSVRHKVVSGTVLSFWGDAEVTLVALSGPCHAVNLMSSSTSLRLRTLTPEPSGHPLAAVVLPGALVGTHTGGAQCFDLYVPSLGTTAAPPFPAAIVELA